MRAAKSKAPACLPHAIPRSATLRYLSDEPTADGRYTSGWLRFGASPYQQFDDEDENEDDGKSLQLCCFRVAKDTGEKELAGFVIDDGK
jgi:hypothetical protein